MTSRIDVVVKIGGGVLGWPEHFHKALARISAAARIQRLLIVPGGGPFADAVRNLDRRIGLRDDAAHWMAVLGMNQYAHLIAAQLDTGALAEDPGEIAAALDAGCVPVLAPYRWLRAADPLPHSWDVTGDSIAAWVTGASGARRLVLVKPPGVDHAPVQSPGLVDAYFSRVLRGEITHAIVAANRLDLLRAALGGTAPCA